MNIYPIIYGFVCMNIIVRLLIAADYVHILAAKSHALLATKNGEANRGDFLIK